MSIIDTFANGSDRATEPLTVTCDHCERTTELSVARLNAPKFVPETCDGRIGARHRLRIMLGPEGKTNR